MNLPPDKVKILSQYDNEKKWDLICDQVGRFSSFSLCFPPTLPMLPRISSCKNKPINGTFYEQWTYSISSEGQSINTDAMWIPNMRSHPSPHKHTYIHMTKLINIVHHRSNHGEVHNNRRHDERVTADTCHYHTVAHSAFLNWQIIRIAQEWKSNSFTLILLSCYCFCPLINFKNWEHRLLTGAAGLCVNVAAAPQ